MLNLVQIQDKLKNIPNDEQGMRVLTAYANGANPMVPPYVALGELNRRKNAEQQQASMQQPDQGTVKDQIAQQVGIMQLQKGRAMQGQQQMAQMMGAQNSPVPQGVGEEPVQMARGGLARLPVRNIDARRFAGGGIVAFQNNPDQPVSADMPGEEKKDEEKSSAFGRAIDPIKRYVTALIEKGLEQRQLAREMPGPFTSTTESERKAFAEKAEKAKDFTAPGQKGDEVKPVKVDPKTAAPPKDDKDRGIVVLPPGSERPAIPGADANFMGVLKEIATRKIAEPRKEEYEEGLASRGLDKMPEMDKGIAALQKARGVYEEQPDLVKRLISGAQDVRSKRVIGSSYIADEKERKKSLADMDLKIANAQDLKAKAEYEFKRGNYDKGMEYFQKAQKEFSDAQKDRAYAAGLGAQAQASMARGSGASGTGLGENALMKINDKYDEFMANPASNPALFAKLPGELQEKFKRFKPGTATYKQAQVELEKFAERMKQKEIDTLRSQKAKQ